MNDHVQKEIVELTKQLIRHRTVEGNTDAFNACISDVRSYFNGISGLHFQEYAHNGIPSLIVSNKPNTKHFDVLFNGHLDVVPAKEPDFTPHQKDGRLYGRGASDMKSSVAAMMAVMKHTAASSRASIGLMLVCDEEIGGFDGTGALVKRGYGADTVIVPDDMGSLEITLKEKGLLQLEVTFNGKAAHSCEPWKGDSATDHFVAFASELRGQYPIPKRDAWVATCNIGPVQSDHPSNQLASKIVTMLDIRYTESNDAGEIIEIVNDLARKHNGTAKVKLQGDVVHTPANNPRVRLFLEAAHEILGQTPAKTVDHGASDARFFAKTGCPIILFKPPSGGMHADNEWVDISGLTEFYSILERYAAKIEAKQP